MSEISEIIRDYWTERSRTYSDSTLQELYGDNAQNWENILYGDIDKNQNLKILDIGTGPGMFAVLLGRNPNFEVSAVDSSKGMIEQATQNAQKFGAKVNFQLLDAQQLPFEDDTFDVIVTRNVTWNLPHPKDAYKEWKRVLKKGGKMINFDSNWYSYLFDENLHKYHDEHPDKKLQEVLPEGMEARMENIAKTLPLSKERRPAWDVNCLLDLGFSKMAFDYNINDEVYDKEHQEINAYAPMFRIIAVK